MSKLVKGITLKQREMFGRILELSAGSSGVALSEMTSKPIFMRSPKLDIVPLGDAIEVAGGEENIAVSVCLLLLGEISGNILLVFPGKSAFRLVDLILQDGEPGKDELDDMAVSVLGEVGNVVSAYFLGTLADHTGLDIRPSSPMVAQDMIGAIVSSAMFILEKAPDGILYIETNISDESNEVEGYLMLFTDESSLESLLQAIEAR